MTRNLCCRGQADPVMGSEFLGWKNTSFRSELASGAHTCHLLASPTINFLGKSKVFDALDPTAAVSLFGATCNDGRLAVFFELLDARTELLAGREVFIFVIRESSATTAWSFFWASFFRALRSDRCGGFDCWVDNTSGSCLWAEGVCANSTWSRLWSRRLFWPGQWVWGFATTLRSLFEMPSVVLWRSGRL